ncbi:hypothetical protein ACFX2I_044512 [Malus domestica]
MKVQWILVCHGLVTLLVLVFFLCGQWPIFDGTPIQRINHFLSLLVAWLALYFFCTTPVVLFNQSFDDRVVTTVNKKMKDVDEFLDFLSVRRGSHRRFVSDSTTFLEAPMQKETSDPFFFLQLLARWVKEYGFTGRSWHFTLSPFSYAPEAFFSPGRSSPFTATAPTHPNRLAHTPFQKPRTEMTPLSRVSSVAGVSLLLGGL